MDKFKLSAKRSDKWWTFGTMKKNQYDNWSIGLRKTPELVELISAKNDGEWINFSAFEDKEKPTTTSHQQAKSNGYQKDLDDEIPW